MHFLVLAVWGAWTIRKPALIQTQGELAVDTNSTSHLTTTKGSASLLYAAYVGGSDNHRMMVTAIYATWASPVSDCVYFIGDSSYFEVPLRGVIPTNCSTDRSGVACKLAPMLIEARRRKGNWLVGFQSDQYLWPLRWEASLTGLDSSLVEVKAPSLGCGKGSEQLQTACPLVFASGGICAGRPFAFSAAAIELMVGADSNVLLAKGEELATAGIIDDMALSEMTLQWKVPINVWTVGPIPNDIAPDCEGRAVGDGMVDLTTTGASCWAHAASSHHDLLEVHLCNVDESSTLSVAEMFYAIHEASMHLGAEELSQ